MPERPRHAIRQTRRLWLLKVSPVSDAVWKQVMEEEREAVLTQSCLGTATRSMQRHWGWAGEYHRIQTACDTAWSSVLREPFTCFILSTIKVVWKELTGLKPASCNTIRKLWSQRQFGSPETLWSRAVVDDVCKEIVETSSATSLMYIQLLHSQNRRKSQVTLLQFREFWENVFALEP